MPFSALFGAFWPLAAALIPAPPHQQPFAHHSQVGQRKRRHQIGRVLSQPSVHAQQCGNSESRVADQCMMVMLLI